MTPWHQHRDPLTGVLDYIRTKRRFFRTKPTMPIQTTIEPLPDDPDNRREDEIQVTRIPDAQEVGNLPVVR
jgi:hypothetical protein